MGVQNEGELLNVCAKCIKARREGRAKRKLLPPGTPRMISCPTRRIWMGSIEGCRNNGNQFHTI